MLCAEICTKQENHIQLKEIHMRMRVSEEVKEKHKTVHFQSCSHQFRSVWLNVRKEQRSPGNKLAHNWH